MENVWFKECSGGRRFLVKISQGEWLVESLCRFAAEAGVRSAVILSAVGSVTRVTFRGIKAGAKLPITEARMTVHDVEGPLELLGLEGNMVPNDQGQCDCHLHILMSRSSGEVIGGHLFDARVFASCEIILSEFHGAGVERHMSQSGGISTIYLED
ncbi:PPC domain-containing DNA-binding protein [Desulfuromonas acetoxidans]|uniref:PPC domain-containing protein n=1 Tax=Desulfuromonas acetoxidans (strain DSM 684 / 11070) TaxID=281689 RepID=Q1JZB6_DESA6|nr:PPC domain-containing DNA-binding protein [Desulfuromonas acetoxidans]EAT15651.1 protein of unknown function DUF296 [Desulfuromonas acetoxidans DSM 684]MBF0646612.1 DNA-binding protein [Desulfuromonas acetoxidans]NVD25376.1 DNA-binding protein [Desulfuromonas acetoxidans]NVE17428.1 DNA-binding protein [Desulfuromonas acetoxidans]